MHKYCIKCSNSLFFRIAFAKPQQTNVFFPHLAKYYAHNVYDVLFSVECFFIYFFLLLYCASAPNEERRNFDTMEIVVYSTEIHMERDFFYSLNVSIATDEFCGNDNCMKHNFQSKVNTLCSVDIWESFFITFPCFFITFL